MRKGVFMLSLSMPGWLRSRLLSLNVRNNRFIRLFIASFRRVHLSYFDE